MSDSFEDGDDGDCLEIRLPEDLSTLSAKLEGDGGMKQTVELYFEGKMCPQDLAAACSHMGQKLKDLKTLLIYSTDDPGPVLRPLGKLLNLRMDTLERLDLWIQDAVSGTMDDNEYFFSQLRALQKLKDIAVCQPYEWEITGTQMTQPEKGPWITENLLLALNHVENLQGISLNMIQVTQTNTTEELLLELCQARDGRPDLKLDIYDCELASSFLRRVCSKASSRVTNLSLTGISNINDAGPELANGLRVNQTLKSLVVRRMPVSTFTLSDLSAETALALVSSLQDNTTLQSLEISIKIDMASPASQRFLEAIHELLHLKYLNVQLHAKSFSQLLSGIGALVEGIESNKELTMLQIKARINSEDGEETVAPPDEAIRKGHEEEFKKKLKTALDQSDRLEEISLEGVITQKVSR